MVLEDSECSAFDLEITEDAVETPFGRVHCTMKGVAKSNRPIILTFHDIGLNHKTCFESLFVHQDMHEIMEHFAVCHVDAPGQQDDASTFSSTFTYPSMDQLEETLLMLLKHFGLRSVVGIGVGAGANILTRFAITGWTHALADTVIPHLFGKEEIQNNTVQIAIFHHHITNNMNQSNLQQFVKSYKSRRDIEIERPVQGGNVNMADCGGLPQVDQPGKLIEAFKYFIQGMGYMPSAGLTRLVRSRTGSSSSIDHSSNRCGTNTSQGQRVRYHTDVSMDSTSKSIEHNPSGPILSVK
ncbi:Protein NDRG1 N-myc downstream-regulated gene 1 protein [Triplophysa tibetana]|uniref:Protein NDRG1 N-myc downstream-regulated gene 1 protein n=1 Tax=Triplophysa tibetana TaxID=1572043 RepID=A0A5A9N067_9TELE|nr:Protein NDRG1 N-myc downstream-regulated gene 1 protein [Triplophysa tibetana]